MIKKDDSILEEIRNLELRYEKLNKKFKKLNILKTKKYYYNEKDKSDFLFLWEKYIDFFKKLKKLIKQNKYRRFFFIINYEKMVIRRYLLIFYINCLIDLVNNFWKHEEFLRILLSEKYRFDFNRIANYIYKPNFINLLNTPVIFIKIFKEKIDKKYYFMLIKEQKHILENKRVLTDYRNFYYYIKKIFYKVLFFFSEKIWKFISKIKFSTRKKWLIKKKNIEEYLKIAKPWDIFLSRWNWEASNIAIPWFWKHMSMYLWTWKFLKKQFLEKYSFLKVMDNNSHYIIEATWEWVEISKIEDFISHNDYLWISRTIFSDDKINRSLEKAIWYFWTPYDFIFNFYSNTNVICSELVLKSYSKDFKNDEWLSIKLEKFRLSLIYPPNNFVKKIKLDKKLKFVMFIDSIEKTWKNFISDEKEFYNSTKRSRFSLMLK